MNVRPHPETLHGDWFTEKVMPQFFDQAKATSSYPEEVVLFVFANLATILQAKGFTAGQLNALVKANAVDTHKAPEGLQ